MIAMLGQKYPKTFCSSGFRQPEVGIVDALYIYIRHFHGSKKRLFDRYREAVNSPVSELHSPDPIWNLIWQNGDSRENFNYADLISAVDSMNCSLEDLRVRLVRIREEGGRDKNL
jgi:hypothetical protein